MYSVALKNYQINYKNKTTINNKTSNENKKHQITKVIKTQTKMEKQELC